MPNPRPSNTALAVLVGVLVAVSATAQDHKPESTASKSAAHDTTAPTKPAARGGTATAKEATPAKPPAKPAVREARQHTGEASHDSTPPAPAARAERTRRTESSARSRRAARRATDSRADAEHAGEAEGHGARDAHASVEGDKPTVMATRARRRVTSSARRAQAGELAPAAVEQVAQAVSDAVAARHQHPSPLHNQPAASKAPTSAPGNGNAVRRVPTPRARVPAARKPAVQTPAVAPRYDVAWPTRSVAIEWPRTADHATLQWPAARDGDTDASTITLKWQGAATNELNRGAAAVAR